MRFLRFATLTFVFLLGMVAGLILLGSPPVHYCAYFLTGPSGEPIPLESVTPEAMYALVLDGQLPRNLCRTFSIAYELQNVLPIHLLFIFSPAIATVLVMRKIRPRDQSS